MDDIKILKYNSYKNIYSVLYQNKTQKNIYDSHIP